MAFVKVFALGAVLAISLVETEAHGRLMDPVNRGSAWRVGFPTPENYDDTGNYCGGYDVHWKVNGGMCGVCGDDYRLPKPRPNENGGVYGTGLVVQEYESGSEITADVEVTANHRGYFTFHLCQLNEMEGETEECFDENPLELATGGYEYPVTTPRNGYYRVNLRLPQGLTCPRCVLRWQYTAGNNWGICPDGSGKVGCGPQETFRTCSDIAIY